MSSDNPPTLPLLNTPFPSSCKLQDHDHYLLNSNDLLIENLSKSNFKKRLNLDDDYDDDNDDGNNNKNSNDNSDENRGRSRFDSTNKRILLDKDEDNNLANQIIFDTVDENIDEEIVMDDDPLPSPSESPKNIYIDSGPLLDSLKFINLIENFSTNSLTKNSQNYLAFKLLSKLNRSTLSDFNNLINKSLKRDFLTNLPIELSINILENLDYKSLLNVTKVSKKWNSLIDENFWKNLLIRDNFITNDELLSTLNLNHDINNNSQFFFKKLYIKRFKLYSNWINPNFQPKRISVRGHGQNVVTCLQFDDNKIITGADDKMINIYNPNNGELLKILQGHEGGVWALKYIGNQIISGSTDRTVRIWNINTGKCTHIFRGHTSTIRCMEIVEFNNEKLIVTGSRDNTLHVWKLPNEQDDEFYDLNVENNPFFVTVLKGHTGSVRSVTGFKNIIISGSYDHTIRVWDLNTLTIKFILKGHTDRIYSTIYDHNRNKCISASMDSSIRVWDLKTGECLNILKNHTSLVGLLGLSNKYLISAAADGTLRGWNPKIYTNEFTLHHDNHSAITTFDSNSNVLVSGSEGQFNIYDLKNKGELIKFNFLNDIGQVWSTKCNFNKCIIAVEKNQQSYIEILDFTGNVE
ncbi:hypothetical protein WICMUC_004161 [Wickerhamomyces mucosus]|uniref:F-box domain-containing protein n=1 Tax=Wickerhamomyces mucosus TaxID=1378264 RepID=A0A9P8TBT9_9ASCO|nr:hypothetical protein WICMUC_004161 [Wickerhamomyces mucosus]